MNGAGVLFVLGLHSPLITQYVDRWDSLGGRGPYVDEISGSLRSVRQFMPNIPIALATDDPNCDKQFLAMFDIVVTFDSSDIKGGWGEKIVGCLNTPFSRTLFLDADTLLCAHV